MQYTELLTLCLLDVTNLTNVILSRPDAGIRHPPGEAGLGDEEWGPG